MQSEYLVGGQLHDDSPVEELEPVPVIPVLPGELVAPTDVVSSLSALPVDDDDAWPLLCRETEGADEGYATTGNCGFTCPPPPGPGSGGGSNAIECSIANQDCGEGEKCAPWANDDGGLWTAARCVPLDSQPGALDQPCVVEGGFASGIDTCETSLVCAPSGPESLRAQEGVCVALCGVGPCADGTLCTVAGPLNVGVCGSICDPLSAGACPSGASCMPAGLGFACNLAASSVDDAPCNAPGQCDVGHVCTDASQCDEELSETCCAQLCDLDAPDCPGGQSCADYGSPLAAYSAVGFCEG